VGLYYIHLASLSFFPTSPHLTALKHFPHTCNYLIHFGGCLEFRCMYHGSLSLTPVPIDMWGFCQFSNSCNASVNTLVCVQRQVVSISTGTAIIQVKLLVFNNLIISPLLILLQLFLCSPLPQCSVSLTAHVRHHHHFSPFLAEMLETKRFLGFPCSAGGKIEQGPPCVLQKSAL
jgi:hypothetical protein